MMLTDLPAGWSTPNDPFIHALKSLLELTNVPTLRVHRGVYLAYTNYDHEIRDLILDDWPPFDAFGYGTENYFNCYGVVDHWTQLPLKDLDTDSRHLLIYLARHAKSEQPSDGGWRWHKWGPYLGVFQEQVAAHEYLHDTPDVVEVFSYRIVELREAVPDDEAARVEAE